MRCVSMDCLAALRSLGLGDELVLEEAEEATDADLAFAAADE